MKNSPSFILLSLANIALSAGATDYSLMPGYRQPAAVPDHLPAIFTGAANVMIAQEVDPSKADPLELRDLKTFLDQNPVSAVAWQRDPAMRSVLVGNDLTLRINDSIPADFLPVGPQFVVVDIQLDTLSFRYAGRDNPYAFPIRLRSEMHSRIGSAKATAIARAIKEEDTKEEQKRAALPSVATPQRK